MQVQRIAADTTLLRHYGRSVILRPGSSRIQVDGKQQTLPAATFIQQDRLYIPARLFATVWDIQLSHSEGATVRASISVAEVTALRHSVERERVRFVLDLNRATIFSTRRNKREFAVKLLSASLPQSVAGCGSSRPMVSSQASSAERSSLARVPLLLSVNDVLVTFARFLASRDFEASRASASVPRERPSANEVSDSPIPEIYGGVTFCINLKYVAPVQTFTLDDPPRVVIDCCKIFREVEETSLRTGLTQLRIRKGTPDGPVNLYAVKVTVGSGFELRPASAGDTLFRFETPSGIARREGAIAATNGGFFARNGSPIGVLVIKGEWMRAGDFIRSGLLITPSGRMRVDTLRWTGKVEFENGITCPVAALNTRNATTDGVFVFTSRWGTSVPLLQSETAITVAVENSAEAGSGIVSLITRPGAATKVDVVIPNPGFVVCMQNQNDASPLLPELGMRCRLRLSIGDGYPQVLHAISAGPRLVENGKECITADEEQFRKDVVVGRAPRTAVGVAADGEIILLAADGRRISQSVGLTLQELARELIDLGAKDAVNLDGGSSTTFVIEGAVVNQPSGSTEPRVSNALIVVPRA